MDQRSDGFSCGTPRQETSLLMQGFHIWPLKYSEFIRDISCSIFSKNKILFPRDVFLHSGQNSFPCHSFFEVIWKVHFKQSVQLFSWLPIGSEVNILTERTCLVRHPALTVRSQCFKEMFFSCL